MTDLPDIDAYYQQLDEQTYLPSIHVQGAWNDHEQHMAPAAGLLAHALEQHDPRPDLQTSRISYEILGLIGLGESRIECRTVRPGRTIELVTATMSVGGRDVIRASAWRLSRQDSSPVAGGLPASMPAPTECAPFTDLSGWPGGFIRSLTAARSAPDGEPGRQRVWLQSTCDLVEGVAVSPLAHFIRLVDSANGIAARVDPRTWMFPNTDLQLHLWRQPTGDWTGLEASSTFGPDGVGLTHTVLHDEQGPAGRAAQILTVRQMPAR
ncbi:thioesterase family protein [Propionibacteriaceae bacterium Y1685]